MELDKTEYFSTVKKSWDVFKEHYINCPITNKGPHYKCNICKKIVNLELITFDLQTEIQGN